MRKWLVGGLIVLSSAVRALAVDRYVLDMPSSVMVGDFETFIQVTPMAAGDVDINPHLVKFMGLPAGVKLEPLAPSAALTVAGPTRFRLSLAPGLAERRVLVRVQKSGDAKVNGAGFFNVDRTVARFSLTPAGMSAPRAGVPFRFQVVAMDSDGAMVKSFKDPVELKVDFGEVLEPVIAGESFKKGVALVDLSFSEGDPGRLNRLEARARNLYAGQTERAAGSIEFTVQPRASGR